MAGLRRRVQEAERSRLLDIFARIPRPPLVASLELQVAARHVETGRIAIDVVERSEEHTSEIQSLMRISYAVFCLKKKKTNIPFTYIIYPTILHMSIAN